MSSGMAVRSSVQRFDAYRIAVFMPELSPSRRRVPFNFLAFMVF